MESLVNVIKNGVVTDTQRIAAEFNLRHHEVMRRIDQVLDDYPDIREHLNSGKDCPAPKGEYLKFEDREYKNVEFKAAVMNREFFTLLVWRLETKRAREAQRKFVEAFFDMERRLLEKSSPKDPEWLSSREQAKRVRREETDVIKEFVEYAKKQGSEHAEMYYKNVTEMTYKALGFLTQREVALREVLTMYELAELLLADRLAQSKIREYMDLGRNYKDIYACVKADLIAFGDACRLAMPVSPHVGHRPSKRLSK